MGITNGQSTLEMGVGHDNLKGVGKRGVMAITTGGEMGGGTWQGVGKTRGYGNHHRWRNGGGGMARGWESEGLWQSPQVDKWGEGHGKGLGKRGVMAITTGGEMGGGTWQGVGKTRGYGNHHRWRNGGRAMARGWENEGLWQSPQVEKWGGTWQGVGKTRGYGNHHRWRNEGGDMARGWESEGLWQSSHVEKWGEGNGKGLGKRGVMAITTGGEIGGGPWQGVGKTRGYGNHNRWRNRGGTWQGVGKARGYGNHHRWRNGGSDMARGWENEGLWQSPQVEKWRGDMARGWENEGLWQSPQVEKWGEGHGKHMGWIVTITRGWRKRGHGSHTWTREGHDGSGVYPPPPPPRCSNNKSKVFSDKILLNTVIQLKE